MKQELFQDNTHSFILKVWVEGSSKDGKPVIWRGHITHVPSGERRYLKDMGDIALYVASYLEEVNAKPDRWRRMRQWLNKWKLLRLSR